MPAPSPHASAPRLADLLAEASQALRQVREGVSLNRALLRVPVHARPAAQAIAFEAVRRLGGALWVRERLVPRAPDPATDALLLCALALLWPGARATYAEHTVVDQAVLALPRSKAFLRGFVNGTLRAFLRRRDELVAQSQADAQARFGAPHWWIERVRTDWPGHADAWLQQMHTHPPLTLRVNRRRLSGTEYLQRLAGQGLDAWLLEDPLLQGQAVQLQRPHPVEDLPGFREGDFSVQDEAAQRAAHLLLNALPPGGASRPYILDACAAPGGKSAHMLEWADIDLCCLDQDAQRLSMVDGTLKRLGLQAHLQAADARQTDSWWNGRLFDAILLDAPCSASGIVRRHPDVPWLRREEDLPQLNHMQDGLLDALWPLLKPGGHLLYATCSMFRSEGSARIDAFLQRSAAQGAELDPRSPGHLLGVAQNSSAPSPAVGPAPQDAFYYALLRKNKR